MPLADRVVPGIVMPAIDRSGGLASRLLVRERNADFVSVNTDTLQAIDDSGRLLPAVIVGHIDWAGRLGVFARLATLRPGDKATVVRADGSRVGAISPRAR